ncbi:hypothetical protein DdX_21359 [Ditylenchus destructor]|uniref:Uncharacterized protein n=1 Tax=Ditylenchus destructor TaxID=166010 RepID=A0AAD4QVM1_9BILA|nr:hypothetical protein DdX_21359 [Ditylenchus destructor]
MGDSNDYVVYNNHHDGSSDVFQFVCQSCEFKFATEYRLLRHEQTCGRESRSEKDMEEIRYKLQMYEMLEESLKYNMTKHQMSGVQKNSGKNGTAETAGASPSVITNESTDTLGNLRTVKAEVQDQVCSATNTQFNVKTEPEDVDASEVEVLGTVEIRKRKAPSKSAEHISQRPEGNVQRNVKVEGESSGLPQMKQAKTNMNRSRVVGL